MSITVKQIVEKYVSQSTKEDIEIEEILEAHPEFSRLDVVNSLKALESEKVGVLVVGRRQKRTRFRKGYMRAPLSLNENYMNNLRNEVLSLDDGTELFLENTQNSSTYAVKFFHGNKNQTVEALKQLEQEGLGVFLIGRRGSYSRFVKGLSREEFLAKTTKSNLIKIPTQPVVVEIPKVEKKTVIQKYTVVSGIVFKSDPEDTDDGFDTLEEALNSVDYYTNDFDKIQTDLDNNGFYKLEEQEEVGT